MAAGALFACLVAVLLGACAEESPPIPPADLVLVNGGIYMVDAERSWAEALAVRDGRIAAIGSGAEIGALIGPATRVIDLAGRMALPGFHDAHLHALTSGYTLLGCGLLELSSVEAILDRLRACALVEPEGLLYATGFDLSLFPGGQMDKAVLDDLFPDRPVYLDSADGHLGWVNSRALELAGVTRDTPNPPGGVIVRDPATGEATGSLHDTAMDRFDALRPGRDFEDDVRALEAAQAHLIGLGITAVIDIAYQPASWVAWRALDQSGQLQLHVRSALTYGPYAEYPPEDFDTVFASRGEYQSGRVDTGSVKLFLDGVLEAHSAALLEPYLLDEPHSGPLNFPPEELNALVTRLDAQGVQVQMHAIGDAAVREGLDAFEAARAANGPRDNRHHITHLQLVHPDDYGRFGELGVTANFQALWAYPDRWILELNLPVVGQERVDRMYPIASIHRRGGRIAGSSDWDVSSANPLYAIETAVRRQDSEQPDGPVLNADERVGLAEMIEAYTINGAWLMHQEDDAGSLEAGKRADIVVLDRDLFEIPATEISEMRVELTIIGGRVVYDARPSADTLDMEN